MRLLELRLFFLPSCAFNGVFFPVDHRESDEVDSTFEFVELASPDEIAIHHYFFKPDKAPKATIFVLHGSGSKVLNWHKVIKPLINDGYQIFMMEYRGFGESQGKATHRNVAEDALKAFSYLKKRNDVEGKPLFLMGQSYGGQPAVHTAFYNQESIDGLILEGTFTSFSEEAAFSSPWFLSCFVGHLVSDAYQSKELIKSIDTDVLIIHSTEDNIVPFEMAGALLENSAGRAQLWRLSGKHVAGLIEHPEDYVRKINQLFSNNRSSPRKSQ